MWNRRIEVVRPRAVLRASMNPVSLAVLCFLAWPAAKSAAAETQDVAASNGKSWIETACKADIRRFCSEADLKQECLVARWDRISPECRNVLGTSAGRPRR